MVRYVSFRFFQSISGLIIFNQERPKMRGLEGELMILNTIVLRCLSRIMSKGLVSWVTSPEIKGLPSITSTVTRCFLGTIGRLWCFTRFLSIKQTEAPESNKALIFMLCGWKSILSGILKQQEGSEDKIGPYDVATLVSHTVPNVAGCCRFSTRFPRALAPKCLRCIKICAPLAPEVSKGNCLSCGPCLHNKNTSAPYDVVLSLLRLAS
jgi:hypothetical protein